MEVDRGADATIARAAPQTKVEHAVVDMNDQQQDSPELMQNNNRNNMTSSLIHQFYGFLFRIMVCRPSLAIGLPRITITGCNPTMEGMDKAARVLEKLVLVWGKAVVLSGFVVTLEMNDFGFIAMICLFIFMRISYRSHMPEESMAMHLISAMTCVASVVFSTIRLVSQHFGETEEAYKATRNLALNAFYVMSLTHALVNIVYHALYVGLRVLDTHFS